MSHKLPANLYEVVANEAMFAIGVFAESGECLYVNNTARQLFSKEEPSLDDLIPPSDRPPFKSFSNDFLKHEGLYQDILVRGRETFFVANIGVKHITFDGPTTYLLMFQDVTLQKKMQREIIAKQNEIKAAFEELLKQNKQLKELDIAKNRFIALTTHELRTPLSAMVASAEILKLKLYDTPEQMEEFIQMIYDQGNQLQDLVNDILDFAKIQAGKMDFYIELRDISTIAKGILNNFTGMAENNKVHIECTEPTEQLLCYFDEVRIRQVISNMVNNAIKYNKPEGKVHIYFEETEDVIKVFIQDTGKGIAKDQFDKVFNEFETIGQVAQHHKGTGLGMPISRKLTEAMGGKLQLISEEGVGSTFWIEIPKHKILDFSVYRSREDKTDDFAA